MRRENCCKFRQANLKVLLDFLQKIAVSKGRAFGRTPQRAKPFPSQSAGEEAKQPGGL